MHLSLVVFRSAPHALHQHCLGSVVTSLLAGTLVHSTPLSWQCLRQSPSSWARGAMALIIGAHDPMSYLRLAAWSLPLPYYPSFSGWLYCFCWLYLYFKHTNCYLRPASSHVPPLHHSSCPMLRQWWERVPRAASVPTLAVPTPAFALCLYRLLSGV